MARAQINITNDGAGKNICTETNITEDNRNSLSLMDIIASDEFRKSKGSFTFTVGRAPTGEIVLCNLVKRVHHLTVTGSPVSDKSTCINSIILSLLFNASSEKLKFLLIDSANSEFMIYNGLPHLLVPVVKSPEKSVEVLKWAVDEMLRRYKIFTEKNVRNISDYNESNDGTSEPLSRIVIVINELAELMKYDSNVVEDYICRLAQMSVMAGIHLIIATQKSADNIITPLIYANMVNHIFFSEKTTDNSETDFDTGCHEDMIFDMFGLNTPLKIQNCSCSADEIKAVVTYIKHHSTADYSSNKIMEEMKLNL